MVADTGHISFYDQIARNKRNSIFLMLAIIAAFVLLAYVIGLVYQQDAFGILIIGIIISIFYVWIGYYNSDKIALASVNAQPADRNQYKQLYNSIEGLCLASGLQMPKVYIMNNNEINAFATGRNPEHAIICVTTGAIDKLNKSELEGVLGHELSHIANYDIRFMTLAAVLVGMIAIVSQIFLRSLWFRSGEREEGKGNAIFLLIGIVLAILAPIFVQLVQLAISRKREYAADASSVKFTRYPKGLISALTKIKNEHVPSDELKRFNKTIAPLFISDPFKRRLQGLFQTHPPIEERIKILEEM